MTVLYKSAIDNDIDTDYNSRCMSSDRMSTGVMSLVVLFSADAAAVWC